MKPLFPAIILFFAAFHSIIAQDQTLLVMPEPEVEQFLTSSKSGSSRIKAVSKVTEDITNAPGVIQVITEQEIKNFGAQSLAELVDRLASVFLFGTYSNPQNIISVRGDLPTQNNHHCLILINGRPLRDPYWGGFDFPVLLGFPVNSISRLEIVKGPGSVLYGTNAFAGIINIVTRKAANEVNLQAGGGSFGARQLKANATFSKGDFALNAGLQHFRETGWNLAMIGEQGDTISKDMGENNLGVNVNASYKGFRLNALFAYSGQDIVGHAPTNELPYDVRNRENEGFRGFLDLGYEHAFGEKYASSIYLNYNSLSQRTLLPPGQFDAYSEGLMIEQTNIYSPKANLDIIFGANANILSGKGEIGDRPELGALPYLEHFYTSYIQTNWTPISWLKIIGGLQMNKVQRIDFNWGPRIGLITSFTPEAGLKLLYGQAFRMGFPAERRFQDPPRAVGNPLLEPEYMNTCDAHFFYQTEKISFSGGYFYSLLDNAITRQNVEVDGESLLQYINSGSRIYQGIEFIGDMDLPSGFQVTNSITYQIGRLDNLTAEGLYVPSLMVKGGVSYSSKLLSAGFFGSYYGGASDLSDLNPMVNDVNPDADAFFWTTMNSSVNLNSLFGFDVLPTFWFNFYAVNLFNQSVYYNEYVRSNINTIPGRQGRSFYLSFSMML